MNSLKKARKKQLFVCYVRLLNSYRPYEYPVYCYAKSYLQASNLATKYCVDNFGWTLHSFEVSCPILIQHFVK